MTAIKGKTTFIGESAFGLAVSLGAAAVALTLAYVMPAAFVGRFVISAIGFAVVMRTIACSDEKTGRIVVLAIWSVAASGIWLAGMSLPAFVLVHASLVWLVRSLFTYSRLIEAGLDFGLTLLAVCFAVFAAVRTESVFLATWCFLLIQALHGSIPGLIRRWSERRDDVVPAGDPNRAFADAFRAAD